MEFELSKFIDIAKSWIGVPYRHRGLSRQGCDCTGLLFGVLREMGLTKDYKLRDYPIDWNLHSGAGNYIEEELVKGADEISKEVVRPGDLCLFAFGRKGCLSHLGIIIKPGLFLHTHRGAGCVKYGSLINSEWTIRWVKTYRLNNAKIQVL